jgi:hypothetical protein
MTPGAVAAGAAVRCLCCACTALTQCIRLIGSLSTCLHAHEYYTGTAPVRMPVAITINQVGALGHFANISMTTPVVSIGPYRAF